MLHRKPHIENHLQSAENRLAARVALLNVNGTDAKKIEKDCQIRKFKAEIRKVKRQLSAIATSETQTAEKIEARNQKEAAKKSAPLQKKSKKRDINAQPAKKKKKRPSELAEGE